MIKDNKTGKIVRVGWAAGYAGNTYGYYLFDSEKEMQQNYALGLQVLKVTQEQVIPFLAGAGLGLVLSGPPQLAQAPGAVPLMRERLLRELARQGIRHTPENILFIIRRNGRIFFLESGNAQAGFQHIISRHGADFAARGVSEAQVQALIRAAISEGTVVGSTGNGANVRVIYEVVFRGRTQRIAIGTGSNGFVVTAHPN